MGGLRREPPSVDRRLSLLLRRQHGVVTRAQLRSLGLGEDAIDFRARTGRLLVIDRGVYAAGHDDITQHGRWLAAVLASGPGAVLSHRSAAALWGLKKAENHIDVSATRDRRNRNGVTVHRPTRLPYTDLTKRHGIPVTRPARTMLDFAEVTARRPLERALDEVQRLKLCTEAELRAAIGAHPGRIGAARLSAVLAEHALGSTATENDFEELFLAICDAHGFPRPRCQEWLMGYRVDFMWQEQRVVVETDGRGPHTTDRAFESDRARDNELGSADWAVRRFTWRQLTREPDWVAAKVAEALARLRPPLSRSQ